MPTLMTSKFAKRAKAKKTKLKDAFIKPATASPLENQSACKPN
jgi:hypothetical protein